MRFSAVFSNHYYANFETISKYIGKINSFFDIKFINNYLSNCM